MDPKELRRLAAEVDEEHRATMRSFVDEQRETFFGAEAAASAATRRSFLRRVGVGGLLAGAGVAAVAVPASAQTSSSSSSSSSSQATTTTTTLPARTTAEDVKLVAFANSFELAAVAAYGATAATGKLSSEVLAVAKAFQDHHREHAQALAGLIGAAAPNKANAKLLAEFAPKIAAASTERQLLELAYQLENAAAASYASLVALFKSSDAVHRVVAIGPIEARHAVVLGSALGKSLPEMIPAFEPLTGLSPTAYPIEG